MDKLPVAFEKAVKHPSVQALRKQTGLNPTYMDGPTLKEFLKKEMEKFAKVAQKAGMVTR